MLAGMLATVAVAGMLATVAELAAGAVTATAPSNRKMDSTARN